MAATFKLTNAVGIADANEFIPTIWSNEVIAIYKKALVMAQLVSRLDHRGKIGDTIKIPRPTRGSPTAVTNANVVAPISFTDTTTTVSINKVFEYSRVIDDLLTLQGLPSLRRYFTDDAGYALAKQTDTDLHQLGAAWGGGTGYSKAVIGSDGNTTYVQTTSGNAASISDVGMRRVVQLLDDGDVPGRDRYLVIPPIEKRKLLGEGRFTESAFTGEHGANNSIRNGFVAPLYGVDVYVSTQVETDQTSDSTNIRAALLFQKEALLLVEQRAVRLQQQYKLEALGNLIVADTTYGVATLRGGLTSDPGDGCIAIMVPNS
jgi:hypothetical protein